MHTFWRTSAIVYAVLAVALGARAAYVLASWLF